MDKQITEQFTSSHYTERHADVFEARYDDGIGAIKVRQVRHFLGVLENKSVLDLGCGIGNFSAMCSDAGAEVVAYDFAESMIQRAARRYGATFPIIRGSVEALPFAAESFDVVLALDVIEHLYNPVDMLRNVHRILKPGGRLIVTTDRAGFRIGRLPQYARRMVRRVIPKGVRVAWRRRLGLPHGTAKSLRSRSKYATPLCTHVCEYSYRELLDLVCREGFQLVNFDTYEHKASYDLFDQVVEFVCRGPLKQYKWSYGIYEFSRLY